jgi:hypothetical protein
MPPLQFWSIFMGQSTASTEFWRAPQIQASPGPAGSFCLPGALGEPFSRSDACFACFSPSHLGAAPGGRRAVSDFKCLNSKPLCLGFLYSFGAVHE